MTTGPQQPIQWLSQQFQVSQNMATTETALQGQLSVNVKCCLIRNQETGPFMLE